MQGIAFRSLSFSDFPLLLRWLQAPHVKAFWDPGKVWTLQKIQEKYASYVEGYKLVDGVKKPIHAWIIYFEEEPVGYVQYYNALEFPRKGYKVERALQDTQFAGLSLAALDIFIGEPSWLGRGIGSAAIRQLLKEHIWSEFSACMVDPEVKNEKAVRCYEKAGFEKVSLLSNGCQLMVCKSHIQNY